MSVYTKTGDKKTTGVIGGRISKGSERLESYGTTDEASAHIGKLYGLIKEEELIKQLEDIMTLFFYIGSDLANPTETIPFSITEEDATRIESYIDGLEKQLEPLKTFTYPTGSQRSCEAGVIRTITRRSERRIVTLVENLNEDEKFNSNILPLINRMSDYFYVLSRYLNKLDNVVDHPMIFERNNK
ncbi:cob(I)yrinic acid a,c-diamide adenosyltransferase [Mycoplasma sp. P36-A1]|uniref:cob(I)yrinic acid a,c-diamide adenosyltransferase n=1 Tax=Mycoplasma sp. P36-A1 TaxID=3252900 RepID=UPI003C2F29DB